MPRNKFEVLRSRVMQCGIEERVVRSMRTAVVKCFRCGEEGHKYRMCPKKEKRVAHPRKEKAHQGERREVRRIEEWKAARPVKGEAQQEEKRTSVEKLRIRAEVYCEKGVPEEAQLFELGWTTKEVVVSYLICEGCGERGCHVEDNRGQGVIPWAKHKALSWCGCKGKKVEGGAPTERKSAAKVEKAAWPREAKAQQSSAWSGEPERAAREGGSRKEVRRTFKMLREVWLNIGVEKIDTHEGVMIKVLLDSGATGMFMDRQTAARHGFKLQKLERPLMVKNVDGTMNSGGAITH